jgi:ATP phosphoribosyltransferase
MTMAASERLILAVPSKGRLQENTIAYLARAGLSLQQERGARDYRGTLAGVMDVDVLFLSASEIAAQLASGAAHLGITGEDLLREAIADVDQRVALLSPLGFGHANVVVAVPQGWIDVRCMADLEDVAAIFHARHGRRMRVATKYVNLTRQAFAQHGVSDYRIVESLGATEGAPAAGTAELIVDITTTGATLASNGLKVLDDGLILKSEANLVASLGAAWTQGARMAATEFFTRIAAAESARRMQEVRLVPKIDRAALFTILAEHEARLAFPMLEQALPVSILCPRTRVANLIRALTDKIAGDVIVTSVSDIYTPGNALSRSLFDRLDRL